MSAYAIVNELQNEYGAKVRGLLAQVAEAARREASSDDHDHFERARFAAIQASATFLQPFAAAMIGELDTVRTALVERLPKMLDEDEALELAQVE